MYFILLQQKDLVGQYFSGLQLPTVVIVIIAIYAFYRMAKMYGWA